MTVTDIWAFMGIRDPRVSVQQIHTSETAALLDDGPAVAETARALSCRMS